MNRTLSAKLILPLHEWLLGRSTLRDLSTLEATQWLSPEDLRDHQRSKLGQLLQHAVSNTAYYRDRFAPDCEFLEPPADVDIASTGGTPDSAYLTLSRLPLLSKDDIRSCIGAMVWHEAPGGLILYSTGGSTGEPLRFFIDRRRQAFDQAARFRAHRWFGVEPGDRQLYLWGSPIEWTRTDSIRRWRDRLFNHRLLSAFDMSPERLDKYLDAWDQFQPVSLFGYPSSIALFVDHAKRRRRKLDLRALKAVFVTGEVCLPADRDAIADYFAVPVADSYGSREAGFITHQCPSGHHHITAENVIVEIVHNDVQVPVGDTGEIVITHLDAYAMPMIRYRTGDIGRLKPGRCICGRGLPMMDVVQGRTTDHLRMPDGTVKHALSIIYPLRELNAVRRFRVVQEANGTVTIDVVADRAGVTRENIASAVRPVVGTDLSLDVRIVDDIPTLDSGKHQYVVSHMRSPSDPPLHSEAAHV